PATTAGTAPASPEASSRPGWTKTDAVDTPSEYVRCSTCPADPATVRASNSDSDPSRCGHGQPRDRQAATAFSSSDGVATDGSSGGRYGDGRADSHSRTKDCVLATRPERASTWRCRSRPD